MKIYPVSYYADILKEQGLLIKSSFTNPNLMIENITYNSKETAPLTLFACKGATFKTDYLDQSVQNGIACYLSEVEYSTSVDVNTLIVSDVRIAMTVVSNIFYDKVYEKLTLIGLTGTKGKSTTAYYVKYILDEYLSSIGEKPTGILSSIDTYDGVIFEESTITTPENFILHKHFNNAVESGLKYFVMEVSSQALKYDRVTGVEFDVTAFLNISEDHISPVEHSDFEDYFSSKLKLFSMSKSTVINLDCDNSSEVQARAIDCPNVIGFTFDEKNHSNSLVKLIGSDLHKDNELTRFNVSSNKFDVLSQGEDFALSMPGLFNSENALTAIGIALSLDIPLNFIKNGLLKARTKGRMEIFTNNDKSVIGIVDYAHNKLSFEKLYQSTLEEYKGYNIITVFGCPGGKAYNRREELGTLSGKYSNEVYLTNDHCAFEDVIKINEQVEKFVLQANKSCKVFSIYDRADAIKLAIESAYKNSKTVVLVAGKGHETVQKIKDEYVPYKSDLYYVKEYINTIS